MGRRDEPELTPSDAELAEAEHATRQLLARFDEPGLIEPPPGLATRIVGALPQTRPPAPRRPAWAFPRGIVAPAALAMLFVMVLVGALTFLPGLVGVAGGPESLLGRVGRALAGTPLGALLTGAGGVALLVALIVVAGGWLWWVVTHSHHDEH